MVLLKLFSSILVLHRRSVCKAQDMDVLKSFQNISWCKQDWPLLSMGNETNDLLKQCSNLPHMVISDDVEDIIRRSKAFPVPFPIDSVRLEKLRERRPVNTLKRNIKSTYPIIHERVLILITHFILYKRQYGTSIEKEFYKNMSVEQLIDRILKKRAVTFMGADDYYKLLTGEEGTDGWESVGTVQQKPPLVLESCLSYDELKLAAMVYVSGHSACINEGDRRNRGAVHEQGAEADAVIIGIIGPRFERESRMDYEDILITQRQNTFENGYGEDDLTTSEETLQRQSSKRMWRRMWAEFYQVPSYTYKQLTSLVNIQENSVENRYMNRYVKVNNDIVFDNEVYYKRLSVCAEAVLLEAEARAQAEGRDAFLNVVGAGLGVWKISSHQTDVYVLTFLERIRAFLRKDLLNHVSDVNLAYIKPSSSILALFTNATSPDGESSAEKRIFFESKRHPRGGVSVSLCSRPPSAKLQGEHEGKLLVLTYPWDGNAHPGNEFWIGSLDGSGDPAAACSTQVSELHNAHINPAVSGHNARVAGRGGVHPLGDYCAGLVLCE